MTHFILNGTPRTESFPPGTTVLDYLRLQARLTGTKEGCAEGDCGACTIAIARPGGEFRAINACIMLADALDGHIAVTAEGVADGTTLAPVQQAMVDLHASQCGFCTPGFVMSLYAFAANPPPPNRSEAILDALAGNLCRCTGYRPIVQAATTLAHSPDPRQSSWNDAVTTPTLRRLEDLDALLATHPDTKLVAGCTDIGVGIAKHGRIPARMARLSAYAGLATITETDTGLTIGSNATYTDILPFIDAKIPAFAALIRRIGSVQIRNAGTMGGNLCNASPIGDSAPCLIALGATLTIRSTAGEHTIAVEDFFTAYRKTALAPGEYLKSIHIPWLSAETKFIAKKLAKRFDQDISTTALAATLHIENGTIITARLAFGGMAATPIRAPALEAALSNQPNSPETFEAAAGLVPTLFTPLSDVRATATYRLQAAANLVKGLCENADIWEEDASFL